MKKFIKKISFLLVLTLLFTYSNTHMLSLNKVFASTNCKITYDVVGNNSIGEYIDIKVNIANVQKLFGASIDFLYDPSLLEVQSISSGNLFNTNNVLTPLGANGKINNGLASFAITLKGNSSEIYSSGTLATIRVKILKKGTINLNTISNNSGLNLNSNTIRVKLSNKDAQAINYSFENKSISIGDNTLEFKSLISNIPSPQPVNSSINLTANASGSGQVEYEFWIKSENSGWTKLRECSTSATYTWKPSVSGNYTIRVYAKDSSGKSISKDLSYTINKK